jgi:protein-arginine kinase activator protein McsA
MRVGSLKRDFVVVQQERYEDAAELRDKLSSHPDNVAKRQRTVLEDKLQSAVTSEDFKVCIQSA